MVLGNDRDFMALSFHIDVLVDPFRLYWIEKEYLLQCLGATKEQLFFAFLPGSDDAINIPGAGFATCLKVIKKIGTTLSPLFYIPFSVNIDQKSIFS